MRRTVGFHVIHSNKSEGIYRWASLLQIVWATNLSSRLLSTTRATSRHMFWCSDADTAIIICSLKKATVARCKQTSGK